jgi:hypothetical protein
LVQLWHHTRKDVAVLALISEFLKEQKLVILAAILGLIYYSYKKNSGVESIYIENVLGAVIAAASYLFVSFLVKSVKSMKD